MKPKTLSPDIKRMLGLDPGSHIRRAVEARMANDQEFYLLLHDLLTCAPEVIKRARPAIREMRANYIKECSINANRDDNN